MTRTVASDCTPMELVAQSMEQDELLRHANTRENYKVIIEPASRAHVWPAAAGNMKTRYIHVKGIGEAAVKYEAQWRRHAQ